MHVPSQCRLLDAEVREMAAAVQFKDMNDVRHLLLVDLSPQSNLLEF